MTQPAPEPNRRDFLTGRAARGALEQTGEQLADALAEVQGPSSGDTLRLSTRAMACDFSVFLNPGPSEQVMIASDALDLVHLLEDQMTVYREHSELSRLNRAAAERPVEVEERLFGLLLLARELAEQTEGAFDLTAAQQIALWRRCRDEGRLPTERELADCLALTGMHHVRFDESLRTVSFDRPGVELNLGGIGKGYALDRAGEHLSNEGVHDWLIHGGHSSVLARGDHNQQGGWPIGLRNPLFPREYLATLLLRDRALSTSGSGVQHFRVQGRRFGHILDPRTGWPVEGMLSVTVVARTAAEADALSTAFFVLGVEKARELCDNREGVGAILIPPPRRGRTLAPIVCGIPEEDLFFSRPQTSPADVPPPVGPAQVQHPSRRSRRE